MTPGLRPIAEQVIVITGATSGIGLVTARRAAAAGARVVLCARDREALRELEREIGSRGGEALAVAGDVGSMEDMRALARAAEDRFGGFDTWVNNAGATIYGRIEDTPLDEQRRLFDTNYWGVVHGSLAALPMLRRRGGALINLGSVLSYRAVPLQGVYSASKFAIRGFTDALRMEVEKDGAPVSVTLIKPGAIATPYRDHGLSHLDAPPRNPPPVYAPDLVAGAILHAAERPVRGLTVGGGGRALSMMGALFPRLTDLAMEATLFGMQRAGGDMPQRGTEGLTRPGLQLRERSPYPHIREHSLYTTARLHPGMAVAAGLAAGAGLLCLAALAGRKGRGSGPKRRKAHDPHRRRADADRRRVEASLAAGVGI